MTLNLLFVGDGPRDEVTVPRLVERILKVQATGDFEAWKELHLRGSGRGLGRKLLYMIRRARDRGANGIVATVDADKFEKKNKLDELKAARNKDRENGHRTPAAIGEANPHLEAWLLDDDVAIRAALNLPSATEVAAPTKVESPKDEINRMYTLSGVEKSILEILASIANQLDVNRCIRARHTGFEAFKEDVQREIGPLSTA